LPSTPACAAGRGPLVLCPSCPFRPRPARPSRADSEHVEKLFFVFSSALPFGHLLQEAALQSRDLHHLIDVGVGGRPGLREIRATPTSHSNATAIVNISTDKGSSRGVSEGKLKMTPPVSQELRAEKEINHTTPPSPSLDSRKLGNLRESRVSSCEAGSVTNVPVTSVSRTKETTALETWMDRRGVVDPRHWRDVRLEVVDVQGAGVGELVSSRYGSGGESASAML